MVGAVLPPRQLAAGGARELLVPVPAGDDEDPGHAPDPEPGGGDSPLLASQPGQPRTSAGGQTSGLSGHLDTGEEPHVASVAVRDAGQGRDGLELGGGLTDRGQGQGQDHPGRGADPQHVLDRQQGGHPQTGRLVLTDDLVTAAQHLGHAAGEADLRQADEVGGVDQLDGGGALLSYPHSQPGLHYGEDDLALLAPDRDDVLYLPRGGVEDLDGVAGAAPDVAGHHHHPGDGVGGAPHRQTLKPCLVPDPA